MSSSPSPTAQTPTVELPGPDRIERLRARFPALERRFPDPDGGPDTLPVAHFDAPGGTQTPREVVAAIADYLFHHNANTHWAFPASAETDEIIDRARRAVADLLNAEPGEIVFGANMTTLTHHAARALARTFRWGPGDAVVVTELDHHANVDPWRALETERGVRVRTVRMIPETAQWDWDDFERNVGPDTRLVAVGAASNAFGTINDVKRAAALARSVGALLYIDAVHHVPHRLVDVRDWDCDFLACSAYKFHGPHVGVLRGKRELLQTADVPRLRPAPDSAPERWESGTLNHEGLAGTAAAVDFLAGLAEDLDPRSPGSDPFATPPPPSPLPRRERLRRAFHILEARERALFQRLWDGLGAIPGLQRHGPPPDRPRTATLSLQIDGHPADRLARELGRRGIFLSHGNFYAADAVARVAKHPAGLLRVGLACHTLESEIDRLLETLDRLARTPPA